jgi:hypothetical protein
MMDLNEMFKLGAVESNDPPCKGLFYRYHTTAYKTKNGFATTQSLTKLKRMSCKGCNWCGPTEDIIETDLVDMNEFPIILPDLIRDGDIIEPYFVPGHADWETGYVEDWEIHARIVEVEKSAG